MIRCDSKGLLTNLQMSTQLGASAAAVRAHEELFAYWAGLKRRGALPGRHDLDPGRIKRLLPTAQVTQADAADALAAAIAHAHLAATRAKIAAALS